MEEESPEPVIIQAPGVPELDAMGDLRAMGEGQQDVDNLTVSTTRDVLPYENWAEAVRRREEPLPENLIHVMNQVFQNDMLLEHILEKVIELKDRAAIRFCRLVSKHWTCAISKLYRKVKKPLFVVNTQKDVFTHNEPPRPIFDHHTILCEFLRPMTRPGRIEGFIPTFALHLSPQFFRKCNYTDFVNCLVQCGPSLVELHVTFPKNSQMSFLLPPGISLSNLTTFGISFSSQTLHSNFYVGPFQHHHQHDYLPNHSSIHLVQSVLNSATHLRNFHFMRSVSPVNPPDLENLYLPDSLQSLRIETPLRGFDFLHRKHFALLTELTLNATFSMYSEGEIYDMLAKLSSTLRSLSLTGSFNSFRQSLPVRFPRMETLTKFAMFKPWEFEEGNPPLSFDEIFPKMEALVFATQTLGSFNYLMSGMRSTSVTSFSVWLTSNGIYNRGAAGPAGAGFQPGFPFHDPNRLAAGNPMLMGNRIEDILNPARIEAQALQARRLLHERIRQRRAPPLDNGREGGRGNGGMRPLHRPVPEVNRRQHDNRLVFEVGGNPGAALPDEWHQERIFRLRARWRIAAEIQRRAQEHHQYMIRRREAELRDAHPVMPRCAHLRRRLQELQERREMDQRRQQQHQPAAPFVPFLPPPPLMVEVVPNQRVEPPQPQPIALIRRPRLQLAPPRPAPMLERGRELVESDENETSDSEDEEELEEMLRVLRPPRRVEGEEENRNDRLRPLQVLAAAALAERQRGIFDELPAPVPVAVVQGMEVIPPPEERDAFAAEHNPAVPPLPIPEDVNVLRGANNAEEEDNENGAANVGMNEDVAENNDDREDVVRGGGDGIDNNERNPEQPAEEDRNNAEAHPVAFVDWEEAEVPRRRPIVRRLPHQMLEDIGGLVARRRPMIRLHHQHLLPDRPVTMTKEKMQSINLAFPNLTKLKINICGPEICGLKYIFEEMISLQVLKIVVEKSLWTITWDSVLTGIPVDFCEAVKHSSELWEEVYMNETQPSIRNLTKLEELGIIECLKVNDHLRHERTEEEHLISDVAFHFAFLKMKNLKHITVTPGFTPSQGMLKKWYQEKGYEVETKSVGRMDTEYEE